MVLDDILKTIFAVCVTALCVKGCAVGLEREAEAQYQKCLAWQAYGYEIRCDESKYK